MSTEKEISKWWDYLLMLGGVFALVNLVRALSKPTKDVKEQYEEIIAQKDLIIERQQHVINRQNELLKHDKSNSELE